MTLELMDTTKSLAEFAEAGSDAPERAARLLKSLAHRDRLKVLCGLLDGELPVAEIEARVGASQSAISQHLAKLREEGIVSCRRDGRQVLYSVSDPLVLDMLTLLYRRFCASDTD